MREMYIERTIEIINQLDNERLKKVYTVAKTLLRFLKEKGGVGRILTTVFRPAAAPVIKDS